MDKPNFVNHIDSKKLINKIHNITKKKNQRNNELTRLKQH